MAQTPKLMAAEGTSVTLNGNANDVITIKAVPFNTNSNGTTYGTVYTATYTPLLSHRQLFIVALIISMT